MDHFENVLTKNDGERMIARLPDEFLPDVLAANDARIGDTVREWAATEELSCEPADLHPDVDDLKRLANIAVVSERSVYLWNCV